MSKKKNPIILSFQELEKKETKELLGYLKRLHQCEESFEKSDLIENPDIKDNLIIFFKENEKWTKAYQDVKAILNKRAHVD